MIVNSFNPEFGYELISVIPYAYYLYKKGLLTKTISAVGTESLYYFSPNHVINPEPRSWANTEKLLASGIPNASIHRKELDLERFEVPNYRSQFKRYELQKPMVIISNRYNNEWPGTPELNRPINFFSLDILKEMLKILLPKYCVAYLNIYGESELQDIDNPALPLGDFEMVNEYPDVITIGSTNYNLTQLHLMSQCERFITTNGGGSILASYFGGKNIIYSKVTELNGRTYPQEHTTGDWNYYHKFGGSQIEVVTDYDMLIDKVKEL
jgi:hypothetical protein